MERLTDETGSYCRAKCGMAATCKRLREGDICQSARCYERLKQYENTGLSPQQVKQMKRPERVKRGGRGGRGGV